jgi:hypothetical protein
VKQTNDNLPPLLMTSDPGSYAQSTIKDRKPKIIQEVIQENDYSPEIISSLGCLLQEIAHSKILPLHEQHSDVDMWNNQVSNFSGRSWMEIPWFFAEAYFYRKLLEAVTYFQPGKWFFWDPFRQQKEKQVQKDITKLSGIWAALEPGYIEEDLTVLLHSALWGNRTDLSNFSVNENDRQHWIVEQEKQNILIDHTDQLAHYISGGLRRVDFINDNTGTDIIFDLALSYLLIKNKWAEKIYFHLKNQPFFVSDAMPEDIHRLVEMMLSLESIHPEICSPPGLHSLGEHIHSYLKTKQLILKEDPFWTSPYMFDQMPAPLLTELKESDLVILKGDVNYRRLLGDRHWPHTTQLEEITGYFPATFAILRTLKSEIIVGLEEGQSDILTSMDPGWLINGKRGIIQFIKKIETN